MSTLSHHTPNADLGCRNLRREFLSEQTGLFARLSASIAGASAREENVYEGACVRMYASPRASDNNQIVSPVVSISHPENRSKSLLRPTTPRKSSSRSYHPATNPVTVSEVFLLHQLAYDPLVNEVLETLYSCMQRKQILTALLARVCTTNSPSPVSHHNTLNHVDQSRHHRPASTRYNDSRRYLPQR